MEDENVLPLEHGLSIRPERRGRKGSCEITVIEGDECRKRRRGHAALVRASHGRPTDRLEDGPVFMTTEPELLPVGPVEAAAVKALILEHVFGRP